MEPRRCEYPFKVCDAAIRLAALEAEVARLREALEGAISELRLWGGIDPKRVGNVALDQNAKRIAACDHALSTPPGDYAALREFGERVALSAIEACVRVGTPDWSPTPEQAAVYRQSAKALVARLLPERKDDAT